MSFLDSLSRGATTPTKAGLAAAVATLTFDGDLLDVERRIIGLFRDQFPPLSDIDEATFKQTLEEAIKLVDEQKPGTNIAGFARNILATSITKPADRLSLYHYLYALSMADLNLSTEETRLLSEIQSSMGLAPADCTKAEQAVLSEFTVLHQALASTVLGLIIVTADGAVEDEEIQGVKNSRSLLDTIGRLDDVQFDLVFDLSLNIHDRFLLDSDNRKAFLDNILAQMLTTSELRKKAFGYAAAVATSDGNLSTQEIETLKEVLTAMQINEADGEAIFNQYMARVKTIDGKPR
jgi:uncharacterized tellurite resistance protein B-like protein